MKFDKNKSVSWKIDHSDGTPQNIAPDEIVLDVKYEANPLRQ